MGHTHWDSENRAECCVHWKQEWRRDFSVSELGMFICPQLSLGRVPSELHDDSFKVKFVLADLMSSRLHGP